MIFSKDQSLKAWFALEQTFVDIPLTQYSIFLVTHIMILDVMPCLVTHTDSHTYKVCENHSPQTHTHTDTHRYTQTHTDTHRHTHRHTHTNTNTHTQTHTHKHTHKDKLYSENTAPNLVFEELVVNVDYYVLKKKSNLL